MISKTNQYALRAVLYIAREGDDRAVTAREIARDLELPANYLSKILNALARVGVLRSERGPRGGFRLGVPADELSLAAVLAPFDAVSGTPDCLLGLGECSDESPCPLHERWRGASDPMIGFFRETVIADLVREAGLRE